MSDTPNTGDTTLEYAAVIEGGQTLGEGWTPDREQAWQNADAWNLGPLGRGSATVMERECSAPRPAERAKPILPTEPGTLVLAHTYDNEERRTFMRRANAQWGDGLLVYGDEELIDPVPVTAIPTADLTALLALANTRGVGDAAIAEAAVALCEQNGVTA